MKKSRAENSTQRLLDLIRYGDKSAAQTPPKESRPTDGGGKKSKRGVPRGNPFKINNFFPSLRKRQSTIGVHLTETDIAMAKVFGGRLEKCRAQAIPENMPDDPESLSRFLGECLDDFTGKKRHIPVWCALDAAKTKLKQLTIPDLPAAKIQNAAFWGFKKESDFDDKLEVFDFEVLGHIQADGLKKRQVAAFSALKSEVANLKLLFSQAGYPLSGITAVPFSLQNFLRKGLIPSSGDFFGLVNVSRTNSEVFCFSDAGILLVRSLRTGSSNLTEDIPTAEDRDPVRFLSSLADTDDPDVQQIRETSERLISKIIRTGDYCAQNYTGNTPLSRYIFFGDTDQCRPFMDLAANMIPAQVTVFDPLDGSDPPSSPSLVPQRADQRGLVLNALGIALSSNARTPNFLFTHGDRQKEKKKRNLALAGLAAGLALVLASVGAHLFLKAAHQHNQSVLARLKQEQAQTGPPIDTSAISRTLSLAEKTNRQTAQYIHCYYPLAALHEICRTTPAHIRLTQLSYYRNPDGQAPGGNRQLLIKGRVNSGAHLLSSELGKYVFALSESAIVRDIDILEKRVEAKNKALAFTAKVELL